MLHIGWRDGWTFYPTDAKGGKIEHEDSQLQEPDGHNLTLLWADFLAAIDERHDAVAEHRNGASRVGAAAARHDFLAHRPQHRVGRREGANHRRRGSEQTTEPSLSRALGVSGSMNRRHFIKTGTLALAATAQGCVSTRKPSKKNPLAEAFDHEMEKFMAARKVPGGALAVIKEQRLVYARGYGWADREQKFL